MKRRKRQRHEDAESPQQRIYGTVGHVRQIGRQNSDQKATQQPQIHHPEWPRDARATLGDIWPGDRRQ